ncbi:UBP-type zinc finger domain-containing protein [Microbacterium sp. LWH13-1.2]|uniref:UBP-type zinc finger domain-containing protein n=2 Tax=Microbacterium TaxID=33882 RepID=UPI0031388556
MTMDLSIVDPTVPPSGNVCVQCDAEGSWWVHLRRCAACGHVGCCNNSPGQHATAHFLQTGHPVIASFEPGEDWFWDYRSDSYAEPVVLAPPLSHPLDQAAPGPASRLPADWRAQAAKQR